MELLLNIKCSSCDKTAALPLMHLYHVIALAASPHTMCELMLRGMANSIRSIEGKGWAVVPLHGEPATASNGCPCDKCATTVIPNVTPLRVTCDGCRKAATDRLH